jgi:hypothetical protein
MCEVGDWGLRREMSVEIGVKQKVTFLFDFYLFLKVLKLLFLENNANLSYSDFVLMLFLKIL